MHLTAEHWEMCFLKNVNRFLKEHGTGIPIVGGDCNETQLNINWYSLSKYTFLVYICYTIVYGVIKTIWIFDPSK